MLMRGREPGDEATLKELVVVLAIYMVRVYSGHFWDRIFSEVSRFQGLCFRVAKCVLLIKVSYFRVSRLFKGFTVEVLYVLLYTGCGQ